MTEPTTTASPKAKALAAGLAFGSAGALAWASFSSQWAQQLIEGTDSFGLRTWISCTEVAGDCEARPLSMLAHYAKGGFETLGMVTSVALWIAAASLAAAAGLMLAGKFVARPIALTTLAFLALVVGMVGGFAFLATRPPDNYGPGNAFWAFAGGELAGIVGSILVARIRPRDPEWDDPQPFDEEKW